MKLTADGGSTKVHWLLTDGSRRVREIFTPGMNPGVMECADMRELLTKHLLPQLGDDGGAIGCVEYYGAGCRGEACRRMEKLLHELFPEADSIIADSDMAGACHAVASDSAAIVCILGTGANSCLCNGGKIIDNVPPLGYILGDEGSGAWLGKRLVADILKELLPSDITAEFHAAYPYSYDELIRHIYRPAPDDGTPNSFLARFAPFLSAHIGCKEIENIVLDGFSMFFDRNVMLYFRRHDLPHTTGIYFVGSVAHNFREQLCKVAAQHGLKISGIRRSPLADPGN
ncbi:MAG: ATPase [Bacteroidales bacterium]|nr:ATPase [Bacteroidales bacterium]